MWFIIDPRGFIGAAVLCTALKTVAECAADTVSCAAQCRHITSPGDEAYRQRAGWRFRGAKWLREGLMGDFQEIKKKMKAQILVKNSAMWLIGPILSADLSCWKDQRRLMWERSWANVALRGSTCFSCTPTVVAQEGGAFSTQPLFCSVPLPSSSRGEGRCQLQMLPCSAWFPAAEAHQRTYAFISTAAACQVRADQTSDQQHVKLIPHCPELFTGRRDILKDNFTRPQKSMYNPWNWGVGGYITKSQRI